MSKEVTFCNKCLMPNTRPWGEFKDGKCGACHFHEKKENVINWDDRSKMFSEILDGIRDNRKTQTSYDVLVPISGGKDGSHVAWTMKEKYNCNVLTATLAPPMWTELGLRNLKRFSRFTGIPNILITPPYDEYRRLNWKGMIEMGYPKRGFVAGLVPSMMRVAENYEIPLIVWGEHEEEYEGEREVHNDAFFITFEDFLESDDFCGVSPEMFNQDIHGDLLHWTIPNLENFSDIGQCYFSRFEKWNSMEHLKTAVNECGMLVSPKAIPGTFTITSQLDDKLYTFFMYMAFLKYGFARVTNDVGIACRQNSLDLLKGLTLLESFESELPEACFQDSLWYFNIRYQEMQREMLRWANRDLLDMRSGSLSHRDTYKLKKEHIYCRREIVKKMYKEANVD